MRIAILSPSENQYSETFIQAHRKYLKGEIFYYSGGAYPTNCNGKEINTLFNKIFTRIYLRFKKTPFLERKNALKKSLKRNKIDVVLAEYGYTAQLNLEMIKSNSIPLIVHFHGFDASVYAEVKKHDNYKDIFTYAKYIVVVSKKMRQMILDLGCPENKIILNTYGPQPEFQNIKPKFTEKSFIGIGRFVEKKAPYYTILAFEKILNNHPDALLYLAGDGPLKSTCENIVRHLGIEKNVIFLGVVSPEIYREYLKKVRGFVQHSIRAKNGDMEGCPLAVLEASVAGLPIISTNHAGIPDVIIHNKTGLLCEEHETNKMSQNMNILLEDIELAQKMGEAGKAEILNNFSIKKHINTLDDLISNCQS